MKQLKKGLLVLLLPLFAFTTAHKFYVSVTNVGYSDKDAAIQITSRVFIDDLEQVLKERYEIEAHLSTNEESDLADLYLEKYVLAKFVVEINGKQEPYKIIGRKYDNDVCIFYLEIANVDLSATTSIQIQNEILFDMFDDQQNVLHYKINGKKKSFVLIKSDAKGMLKL